MHVSYNELVNASTYGDTNKLVSLYQSLIVEKMKLDKFFSMFLDRFSDEMDPKVTNTKIWKLYNSKTKDYTDLNQVITAAEYYLKKNHV
jgi:hypothetical protein